MKLRGLIPVAVMLLTVGCVSSGTHDAVLAELDACRNERLKTQDQAKTELDAQFVALQKLETELDGKMREIEACQKTAAAANEYSEKLKQREADLRGKLQKELADKDVTISRLKDQLSVQVMDKILFKTGRADIQPAGQAVLEKLAGVLKDTDDMIRVEGHTDNVPIGVGLKDKYFSNWELSGARAASVVRYFQHGENKIDPLRLEPVGYGEYRPVAPNDTAENKQRNRRVEIVLTAVKPPIESAPPAKAAEPASTP
jgi:chemotaxis protein MotB